MMKNLILVTALAMSTTLFSQSDRHEKIKALKVAHITEQLELSATEAEKFWPIYNASEEKMHAIRRAERKEIIGTVKKNYESLTESEANALIEKSLELKRKELKTYSELVVNLKGVIPSKKIILLRKAEEDFKRKLLERYKSKKNRE